jgi:hypothetical protein
VTAVWVRELLFGKARLFVAEEVQLNWSKWMRQTHRSLSIVFTVAVIINGVTVVEDVDAQIQP